MGTPLVTVRILLLYGNQLAAENSSKLIEYRVLDMPKRIQGLSQYWKLKNDQNINSSQNSWYNEAHPEVPTKLAHSSPARTKWSSRDSCRILAAFLDSSAAGRGLKISDYSLQKAAS
ncbi:unnamed protein product [Hermetia illucens]|uniref:Uncharacterized protein n=1 Tax=Hermetia illucens TaxID=343691 RepID=A0A7R8UXF8_HERIL|nr:unnamed protein product [Hermetia illucens]